MTQQQQHLVFWLGYHEPRACAITYSILYNGCGFSGTETAVVEVAKYLTSHFKVTVVCNTAETEDHGITFTQTMPATYDIFCPTFHVPSQDILDKMPHSTVVWIWMQFIIHPNVILAFAPRKVIGSYLSSFVEAQTRKDFFADTITVGNGISKDLFAAPLKCKKRPGSWVFHATHERGGAMVERIFRYVRHRNQSAAQSLIYASYYLPKHHSFNHVGSLPKGVLCDLLSGTEYFVYPLVLPNGQVHHDTYACVILEALARGVIVITWNVACIPGVYADYVVALEPEAWQGYDATAGFGANPWMLTDEAVARLGDAVLSIDADPARKNAIRERGMAWAHTQTWDLIAAKYQIWLDTNLPRS